MNNGLRFPTLKKARNLVVSASNWNLEPNSSQNFSVESCPWSREHCAFMSRMIGLSSSSISPSIAAISGPRLTKSESEGKSVRSATEIVSPSLFCKEYVHLSLDGWTVHYSFCNLYLLITKKPCSSEKWLMFHKNKDHRWQCFCIFISNQQTAKWQSKDKCQKIISVDIGISI